MSIHYYDAYLETSVESASPLQLIHLAYESAIEAVRNARRHLEDGRITERSRAITKAMKIIRELSGALDHQSAAVISLPLARLYRYMIDRLREANFTQLEGPLIEVEELLRTVGDSWSRLAAAETESEHVFAAAGAMEQRPREPGPAIQAAEARSYSGAAYGVIYTR
jgi:flagellar secretion chaperone FliS